MAVIFLIDDNEAYCKQIQKTLELREHKLHYETDPQKAIEVLTKHEWDVVLLDVVFQEDLDGLQVLEKIKSLKPDLPVIMVSAASTLQTAMEAVKKGAFDYLDKPINVDRMTATIEHALEHKRLINLNRNLLREIYKSMVTEGLSTSVQKILNLFSELDEPWERILLVGEKGTGKEMLAKIIHYKSDRKFGPFISFYCDARFPEQERRLFEDYASQKSLIRQADNGTLFIGEISRLSKDSQRRLAQFIHENYYMPASSRENPALNIRLVASTSQDLKALTEKAEFSEELYNFLNTLTFRLPPLRERLEDIPVLADHFLSNLNSPFIQVRPEWSPEAIKALQSYSWPENISELKTVIWILAFFNRSEKIEAKDVKSALQFYKLMQDIKKGASLPNLTDEFYAFYDFITQQETVS